MQYIVPFIRHSALHPSAVFCKELIKPNIFYSKGFILKFYVNNNPGKFVTDAKKITKNLLEVKIVIFFGS